jgi:hypothetical protein
MVPWLEPDDWVGEGQFDTPRSGPSVPSLRSLSVEAIVGRRIVSVSTHVGTYGMAGPGFLGLNLEASELRPMEWLVLCLWGATEWCLFDGKPVESNRRSRLDEVGSRSFAFAVTGKQIVTASIADKCCELVFGVAPGSPTHRLEIPMDTSRLPVYAGSGRRRRLAPSDSLLDAWVLSPTDLLYV